MQCPIDGEQLVMTERSGVEIDYCPKCRGVWLDRGELDKIIERSAATQQPSPQAQQAQSGPSPWQGDTRSDSRYQGKKKKESFLSELFDF
ncbi:zf-TFIIB domain-containing protein [Fodinicurvata halophila]|uniref:Zf-TFIIB domain-containing protein n=1 Tax=Fodinicurvata halophila TaxID=1419723 RepID=A0ABV8UKI6_9PROT